MDNPKPGCSGLQKRKILYDKCGENYLDDDQVNSQKKRRAGEETSETEEDIDYFNMYDEMDRGILDLPDDVLFIICRKLLPFDLYSLSRACRRFEQLVTERSLWRYVDFRDTTDITTSLLSRFNQFLSASTLGYSTRARGFVGGTNISIDPNTRLMTGKLLSDINAKCTRLKEMRIEDDILYADELSMKDMPSTLELLSLSGSIMWNKPAGFSYFFRIDECLRSLTTLCLRNCVWFEPHSLMLLSKMTCLEYLDLSQCVRLSECMAYFSLSMRYGFLKLKTFDLRETRLGDSEISCLNGLPSLTELLLDCPQRCRGITHMVHGARNNPVVVLHPFDRHGNRPGINAEDRQPIFVIQRNRDPVANARQFNMRHQNVRNPVVVIQRVEVDNGDVPPADNEIEIEPEPQNARFLDDIQQQNPVVLIRRGDNIRFMNGQFLNDDNIPVANIDLPAAEQPDIADQDADLENAVDVEENIFPPQILENNIAVGEVPQNPGVILARIQNAMNDENNREEVYRDANIIVERVRGQNNENIVGENLNPNVVLQRIDFMNPIAHDQRDNIPRLDNEQEEDLNERQYNQDNNDYLGEELQRNNRDNRPSIFYPASRSRDNAESSSSRSFINNSYQKLKKPNDKTTQTESEDDVKQLMAQNSTQGNQKIDDIPNKPKVELDELDQYIERRSIGTRDEDRESNEEKERLATKARKFVDNVFNLLNHNEDVANQEEIPPINNNPIAEGNQEYRPVRQCRLGQNNRNRQVDRARRIVINANRAANRNRNDQAAELVRFIEIEGAENRVARVMQIDPNQRRRRMHFDIYNRGLHLGMIPEEEVGDNPNAPLRGRGRRVMEVEQPARQMMRVNFLNRVLNPYDAPRDMQIDNPAVDIAQPEGAEPILADPDVEVVRMFNDGDIQVDEQDEGLLMRNRAHQNVVINLDFGIQRANLPHCFISDRAICSFGTSPAAHALNLVRIQAEYMPQQRDPVIERLTIRNYRLITDQSLRHLSHAAPRLRYLDVTGTKVTKEGVSRFKEERPECEILSDFSIDKTED